MESKAPKIRPTRVEDIAGIGALIQEHSFRADGAGALLPVSPQQILRMVGDPSLGRFFSALSPVGDVAGCVSIAVYGMPANREEVVSWLRTKLPLEEFGMQLHEKDEGSGDGPAGLVAELRSLAVAGSHRGHDLGLRLIETAKAEARSRGFRNVYSLVNQKAMPLFERAGFRRAHRTPQKLVMDCAVCPILDQCNEVPFVADLG